MWQKMSVLESESAEDTADSQPLAGSVESRAQGCRQSRDLLRPQAAERRGGSS